MTIINHILSGAARSLRSWKWILVAWFVTFVLVALVVYPFRSALLNVFGSSMITEKLKNGFDLDVFSNAGAGLSVLASFFTSGVIIVILAGWLLNVFLSGGFFHVVGRKDKETISKGFFAAAASNFWSYLAANILIRLMVNIISFLIIGLPLIIMASDGTSEKVPKILMISGSIFLLILPVFLLITDYARAWQAASPKKDAIMALGNGFKYTFRYFFSSWIMMFIIVAIQSLFTIGVFIIITMARPTGGMGIFLMFVLSQVFFIVKIGLRTWRYGIITSKFEAHS